MNSINQQLNQQQTQRLQAMLLLCLALLLTACQPIVEQDAPTTAVIEGRVWHDLCAVDGEGSAPLNPSAGCSQEHPVVANGVMEPDEPGLAGVTITIGPGDCAASDAILDSRITDQGGQFTFGGLAAGTYCLGIDVLAGENLPILVPGGWTHPTEEGRTAVTLAAGENAIVNFGWDYQFLPLPEGAQAVPVFPVLNWQIGVVPDEPALCRRLVVTNTGFAQAQTESCASGLVQTSVEARLNASAQSALDHWLHRLAPLTVEHNVLAGRGTADATIAEQQAILAWVVSVYSELTGQVSATGPTAMSWFVGSTPEEDTLCQHLTVLRYGYATAELVPCSSGPAQEQPVQEMHSGMLTAEELTAFMDWSTELAPLYVDENYLDGSGLQNASAATIAEIAIWAEALYARLATQPAVTAMAFVREGVFYIDLGRPDSAPVVAEDCQAQPCRILFPKWSPDGTRLLYYRELQGESRAAQIRIATLNGETQTVAEQAAPLRPADWSPDGTQVIYLHSTQRVVPSKFMGEALALELYTADVDASGHVQNEQLRGEVGFGEGCGGGGRSNSAELYEIEGGFAYGYLAGIVEWTPGDILLFSNNCGSRGVGRFDLAAGQEIEPYADPLRSLTLDSSGQRWAAIDSQNQIVVGTPDALDYRVLGSVQHEEGAELELVYFGGFSGKLYYTTLKRVGDFVDMTDAMSKLGDAIPASPYFDFTQPALYGLDSALRASTLLWQGDGYAYARLSETENGGLLFSRVEDNAAFFDALSTGTATVETVDDLLPTVDLLYLPEASATPELWLENAQQMTPAVTPTITPTVTSEIATADEDLAFTWHRQGGAAGFCDNVAVSVTGQVHISSCRDEQGVDIAHLTLNAGQLASVWEWLQTYAPFEYRWTEPTGVDGLVVTLFFSGTGQEEAMEPDQGLIVDFAQNLFNEGRMAVADAPAACPSPGAEEQLLLQEASGYCLLYPAAYSLWQQSPASMEIISRTIMNHLDPRVSISVEPGAERTLDDVATEIMANYAPPGFTIEVQPITVDGQPAVLLDNLPGQDLNRRVVLIHKDRLYSLFFGFIGEPGSETRQAADALYETVITSFRLFTPF